MYALDNVEEYGRPLTLHELEAAFCPCKSWAMRAELESKMERTEMRMIRWLCGVSLGERQQ